MLFSIFFKVLYVLLHATTTLCSWLANKGRILCEKIHLVTQGRRMRPEEQLAFIHSETKFLDKMPRHVTVLIGHESPSYVDLARIIIWSLAAGVTFVSFYDHKGELKKTEADLVAAVEETKPEGSHVIWHNQSSLRNGHVGRKVHVKLLSLEDGQEAIVRVTRALTEEKLDEIDVGVVDGRLRQLYEFPNPDLAICCGQFLSLDGYPPWQIQTTEFTNVRSHHQLNVHAFLNVLKVYSRCEQRFGK